MATIISADEIKKKLPNYSPGKAELFHQESAREADRLFTKVLKASRSKKVILLNGGTASGKTEFMETQLKQKPDIIFDATLSTELGAKIKIKQILKAGKTPDIYAIIPDDLRRAFIAFLNRDRKFSDAHFYKTHAGSRKTLLWIAEHYPQIKINLVESYYTLDQKLQFTKVEFNNRSSLIKYLIKKQATEDGIIISVYFAKRNNRYEENNL